MSVISGGNVIRASAGAVGVKPRTYYGHGAPDATTYAGVRQVGEFYVDVDTGNLYEYTEPGGTPTWTRIDTV